MVRFLGGTVRGNGLKGAVICEPFAAKVRSSVLTGHFVAGNLRSNMANAA